MWVTIENGTVKSIHSAPKSGATQVVAGGERAIKRGRPARVLGQQQEDGSWDWRAFPA